MTEWVKVMDWRKMQPVRWIRVESPPPKPDAGDAEDE